MSSKFCRVAICGLFAISGVALHAQQTNLIRQKLFPCSQPMVLHQNAAAAPCKATVQGMQPSSGSLPRRRDDNATYVSFDVPGAANGTLPQAINNRGIVTGYWIDASLTYRGFVRQRDGDLFSFYIPGADGGTYPAAINESGSITGEWCTGDYSLCPGFVRDKQGNVTSFDAPGDVNGTNPTAIAEDGTITGQYYDASFLGHGFLRCRDGSIVEFDVPGADWTVPWAINNGGTIAGSYQDANGWHGFVRSKEGNITTFDVPGGGNTGQNALFGGPVLSINPQGEITSAYIAAPSTYDGFLRHRNGSFDTFYAANYPPCCIWTFPTAVLADETISGYQNDGYDLNHGFIRDRDGHITTYDVPGAGTGEYQGTVAVGMNAARVAAGFYIDGNGVSHGFLRIP